MLSRLVIAFLPGRKHLLISWLQSPSAVIWDHKKIRSATVPTVSPSICREVTGPDVMIFVFWMLSFKPTFSLTSLTFIKRLFSSSLSAIRVVSSAYLRLLIFLLTILIPACASSCSAFIMMYPAYILECEVKEAWHAAVHGVTKSQTRLCDWIELNPAYKLNKQGNNIQPWRTPFPIWSQSVVPCPVLTIVS